MFEDVSVGEIIKDLRSIKVSTKTRDYIDRARVYFEGEGDLPLETQRKLRKVYSQYSTQVKALHESRSRARKTNGLKALGISKEEADRRVKMRESAVRIRRNDVGF